VYLKLAVGDFWIGGFFSKPVGVKKGVWRWDLHKDEVMKEWLQKLEPNPWSSNKPDDATRNKDTYLFLEHPTHTITKWNFANGKNQKNFICEDVRFHMEMIL